jgi:hypothetical protein
MTQTRLDVVKGGHKQDVTVNTGSSIGTSAARIMYDTTVIASKEDLLLAIEACRQYVLQAKWPIQ